jgi:hypothetical protein
MYSRFDQEHICDNVVAIISDIAMLCTIEADSSRSYPRKIYFLFSYSSQYDVPVSDVPIHEEMSPAGYNKVL